MDEIYHALFPHRSRGQITSMHKHELFRSTDVTTDCDECGGRVDLIKGGVCVRCRRILCYRHLHGSFVRRLLTDLGADTVCVSCRASGR
jgi:hypothetical protein